MVEKLGPKLLVEGGYSIMPQGLGSIPTLGNKIPPNNSGKRKVSHALFPAVGMIFKGHGNFRK